MGERHTRQESSAGRAAAPEPGARGIRSWVSGLLCVALFAGGALLMADWLHERGTLGGTVLDPASEGGGLRAAPVPRLLPTMDAHVDREIGFGPVRVVSFGASSAWMSVASSKEPPEDVFTRVLMRRAGGLSEETIQSYVRMGPSVQAAMRMQVSVGRFAAGAFLLHLPPDVEAVRQGDLRFEPGAITLAFRTASGWDYVAFYFPDGLDLSGLVGARSHARHALDGLGADVSAILEPRLRIPLDGLPGPDERREGGIILCRARRGTAGSAVASVASRLEGRGWRRLLSPVGDEHSLCVLRRPSQEIWLSATEAAQQGGVVTVVIRNP